MSGWQDSITAWVKLASFSFWIGLVATIAGMFIFDELTVAVISKSVFVASASSVWVTGAAVLQYAKLTEYNVHTSWLIGVLIGGSNALVLNVAPVQTLVVIFIAWALAYALPILVRKIDKYKIT